MSESTKFFDTILSSPKQVGDVIDYTTSDVPRFTYGGVTELSRPFQIAEGSIAITSETIAPPDTSRFSDHALFTEVSGLKYYEPTFQEQSFLDRYLQGSASNSVNLLTASMPAKPEPHRVDTAEALGELVRQAREDLEMSQQEIADFASVGRRFVSELERGAKDTLEIGKVFKVCAAVGIDLLAQVR